MRQKYLAWFWLLALAAAMQAQNADRGKQLFERRCTGCHSLDQDREGPRLGVVYGRASGSVPSFQYSKALKTARITWDAASLDRWLQDSERFVPGNNMDFQVVLKNERADLIAYLKQLARRPLKRINSARGDLGPPGGRPR